MRQNFVITKKLLCGALVAAVLFGGKIDTAAATKTTTPAQAATTANAATAKKAKVKVGTKKWQTKMEVKTYKRNGKKIYGELYRPVGDGPFPAVVFCHGFNSTCGGSQQFARELAENGVVAYIFDFQGGSPSSRSGGSTTDMSVLTEAEDLKLVFNATKKLSYVDESRMFNIGESMGGFVSTYVAANMPGAVKGLIELYPAYNLGGPTVNLMVKYNLIPEQMNFLGMNVGRKFFTDLSTVDINTELKKYSGKTLIIHGTNDSVVPYYYSQNAVKNMKNAKLVPVNGAEHGFGMNATVKTETLKMLKELCN